MKKKILTFLFAICLILPCAFIMTACNSGGDTPPPGPQSPVTGFGVSSGNVEFYLRDINANDVNDMTEPVFNGGTNEFSMWLSDSYDRDTLKVFVNNEEVEWTKLDDPEYDTRAIDYFNIRKIGTLSLSDLKGNIDITVECEEEEISLVFEPQTLDADKMAILSDFHFITKDEGGNNVETAFDTVAQDGFTIKTTYSQIVGNENALTGYTKGILVESNKKMGYYNYYSMIMGANPEIDPVWDSHICSTNKYQSYMLLFGGSLTKEIALSFNPEMISVTNLEIGGMSVNDKITTISHNSWNTNENTAVTISLNPYDGVDFSEATLWIYDREIPFENVSGTYQVTIPAGALPVDYYNNATEDKCNFYGDAFSPLNFAIYVDGLDYSNAVFHTVEFADVLDKNVSGVNATPYYSEFKKDVIGGFTYTYYQSYYRHNESAVTGFQFMNNEAQPDAIILREKIDGSWTERTISISEYYDLDPNNYPDNEYIVNNVVDDIDIVVKFYAGSLQSICIRFSVQYQTEIAPSFN